jgi:hypothetical protein
MTTRTHNGFTAEAWAMMVDAVQQLERCREQNQAKSDALRAVERALAAAPLVQHYRREKEALAIVRAALGSE